MQHRKSRASLWECARKVWPSARRRRPRTGPQWRPLPTAILTRTWPVSWPSARKPWRPGLPAQRYPNQKVMTFEVKLTSFFAMNGLTSTDAHNLIRICLLFLYYCLRINFTINLINSIVFINLIEFFMGFWCLELPFPGQVWIPIGKSPVCWSIRPAPGKKGHVYYTGDDKGSDGSVCLSKMFR